MLHCILKGVAGSAACDCVCLASSCSARGAGAVDDGVAVAAAAGAGPLRQLLRLWDRDRRLRHHQSGDRLIFTN